jgi:hypothetical protein
MKNFDNPTIPYTTGYKRIYIIHNGTAKKLKNKFGLIRNILFGKNSAVNKTTRVAKTVCRTSMID